MKNEIEDNSNKNQKQDLNISEIKLSIDELTKMRKERIKFFYEASLDNNYEPYRKCLEDQRAQIVQKMKFFKMMKKLI